MRLYVTGGTGLVGSNVIKAALERHRDIEIVASLYGPPPEGKVDYRLDPLDMQDHDAIRKTIHKHRPDAVIHSAALLDQSMMHRQRALAWSIMVEGTRAFALACRETGVRLVFVSSDWVFDGTEPVVDEESPPFPVNFYGIMKMASERELSAMDDLSYGVGRLAGVYGINCAIRSLTRWVQGVGFGDLPNYCVDHFSKGQPVEIWLDGVNEAAHPTLASDAADMLLRLARHEGNGIFHCFGSEAIDRVGLAQRVAEVFAGDPALIRPAPLPDEVKTELGGIRIPFRTVASVEKTAKALGRTSLNVVEGLKAFKQEVEALHD